MVATGGVITSIIQPLAHLYNVPHHALTQRHQHTLIGKREGRARAANESCFCCLVSNGTASALNTCMNTSGKSCIYFCRKQRGMAFFVCVCGSYLLQEISDTSTFSSAGCAPSAQSVLQSSKAADVTQAPAAENLYQRQHIRPKCCCCMCRAVFFVLFFS